MRAARSRPPRPRNLATHVKRIVVAALGGPLVEADRTHVADDLGHTGRSPLEFTVLPLMIERSKTATSRFCVPYAPLSPPTISRSTSLRSQRPRC